MDVLRSWIPRSQPQFLLKSYERVEAELVSNRLLSDGAVIIEPLPLHQKSRRSDGILESVGYRRENLCLRCHDVRRESAIGGWGDRTRYVHGFDDEYMKVAADHRTEAFERLGWCARLEEQRDPGLLGANPGRVARG